MSINLEKGSKIDLTKIDKTLKQLNLCLGWDTRMDLDAFAILLDENNKVQLIGKPIPDSKLWELYKKIITQ